ncbi:MAG: hypothetical protein ACR2JW_16890 [Thermomicrobiales bacterium]
MAAGFRPMLVSYAAVGNANLRRGSARTALRCHADSSMDGDGRRQAGEGGSSTAPMKAFPSLIATRLNRIGSSLPQRWSATW